MSALSVWEAQERQAKEVHESLPKNLSFKTKKEAIAAEQQLLEIIRVYETMAQLPQQLYLEAQAFLQFAQTRIKQFRAIELQDSLRSIQDDLRPYSLKEATHLESIIKVCGVWLSTVEEICNLVPHLKKDYKNLKPIVDDIVDQAKRSSKLLQDLHENFFIERLQFVLKHKLVYYLKGPPGWGSTLPKKYYSDFRERCRPLFASPALCNYWISLTPTGLNDAIKLGKLLKERLVKESFWGTPYLDSKYKPFKSKEVFEWMKSVPPKGWIQDIPERFSVKVQPEEEKDGVVRIPN